MNSIPVPTLDLGPTYISIPFVCISSTKDEIWNSSCVLPNTLGEISAGPKQDFAPCHHHPPAKTPPPTKHSQLPKKQSGLLSLPALLIDKGFTISKLKSLPSRKTITDRRNGSLLCYPLGHLNVSDTFHLKHHIPNVKLLQRGHTHNTLPCNFATVLSMNFIPIP